MLCMNDIFLERFNVRQWFSATSNLHRRHLYNINSSNMCNNAIVAFTVLFELVCVVCVWDSIAWGEECTNGAV